MKKFVSKQVNYRVVLRHGQPAEPLTGRNAVPGVYVKFENGLVTINDEETCEMMMKHPGYNTDFILVEEGDKDPWVDSRRGTEPEHAITTIEYGHVGKSTGKPASPFTRDQQSAMKKMAEEMAAEMAPKIAVQMLEQLAKKGDEKKEEDVPPEENSVKVEETGTPVTKKPFCTECTSKGVRHLKDCPNNPSKKIE
jgi:hypothetical protein